MTRLRETLLHLLLSLHGLVLNDWGKKRIDKRDSCGLNWQKINVDQQE